MNPRKLVFCAIVGVTQLGICPPTMAVTLFVKEGSSGTGTSWSDAFGDLQSAIFVAMPLDEIWVASGNYRPGTLDFQAFDLPDRVRIKGGYAAAFDGDTSRDPDPATNNTVLSGDLGNGNSHVIVNSDEFDVAGTELRGFRITGAAQHAIEAIGGSAALFADLVVEDNTDFTAFAFGGAGMLIDNSAVRVENCQFISNRTEFSGGALLCAGAEQARFEGCTFWDNSANNGGGAVYLLNAIPRFENTLFFENFTGNGIAGGAMLVNNGGVTETMETLVISGCRFAGNNSIGAFNPGLQILAGEGGAIYLQGGALPAAINNSEFSGNFAGDKGGAIVSQSSGTEFVAAADIVDCVFSENFTFGEGGAVHVTA